MPKPSRSAFYFYALEYQRRIQRTQGTRLTINDAIAACYDEWKSLSDDQKQPYKILYEEWRIQYRLDPEQASGYSSQQRLNQLKKAQKQEEKSEQILSQRVIPCEELKIHYDRFSCERDFLAFEYLPLDINELLTMPIYLINFQIFCKVDEEDGGQYVPAEICVLRYTLAEGVTMSRQTFIKPDKIPAGYMSACLEQSKTTHEIPLKDFAEATDNYDQIYHQLKSFLIPTVLNKTKDLSEDDRTRRRYLRLTQPCVFFPAVEYEQTSRILEWLQEKVEGTKPTKDTRLVNYASIESLIMLLVELKKQRVSRDEIHKTFENAAYSFMIEERCNYHTQLGISHCSVARCYALAKLLSSYLNQLYAPERTLTNKRSVPTTINSETSSMISINHFSTRLQPQPMNIRPSISSQYSTTGTSDSIASSYRPHNHHHHPIRPILNQPNKDIRMTDELIHHPTIIKLQQQNFHRLLSNADTSTSSSSVVKPSKDHDDEQSTCVSSTHSQVTKTTSDTQRAVLHQRKQALMKAIQSINKQMEELDMP